MRADHVASTGVSPLRVIGESLSVAALVQLLDEAVARLPLGASLAAQVVQELYAVRGDAAVGRGGSGDGGEGGCMWVLQRPRCDDVLTRVVDDGDADDGDAYADCHVACTCPVCRRRRAYAEQRRRWGMLLRVSLCAASCAPRRRTRARNMDGRGRALVLLHTLVTQCVAHDASAVMPVLFATDTCTLSSSPTADVQRRRSRLRVVAALRALASPQSVRCCCDCGISGCTRDGDAGGRERCGGVDWCAHIVHAAVARLRRSKDVVLLHELRTADELVHAVTSTLHHILATEVEGDVLDTLRDVLVRYCVGSCTFDDGRSVARSAASLSSSSLLSPLSTQVLCAVMSARLSRLTRRPASVWVCSSCSGPVRASRLVPAHVLVLPTLSAATTMTMAQRLSAAPRTPLLDLRSSNDGGKECGVAVAFVRVDPHGNWLADDVAAHNTRTFYSHYANDEDDDSEATHTRSSDSDSDSDDFYTLYARGAGTRRVARARKNNYTSNSRSKRNDDDEEAATVADDEVRRIVRCLCRLMHDDGDDDDDDDSVARLQLAAAVRLFAWALDAGVRVVLTPERLPALVKRFGEQHLGLLHCLRTHTHAARATRVPAVHVLDELHLDAYAHARDVLCGSGDDADSVAAVLSRNRLVVPSARPATQSYVRQPMHNNNSTTAASVASNVAWLSRVTVMTATRFVREGERAWLCGDDKDGDGDGGGCARACADVTWTRDDCVCLLMGAATATAPPPPPPWLRAAQCIDAAPIATAAAAADTTRATMVGSQAPRILLVAPTQHHVATYRQLLHKAAAALHAALVTDDDDGGNTSDAAVVHAHAHGDFRGVVRAGGALYVALAHELRVLAQHVRRQCAHDTSATDEVAATMTTTTRTPAPAALLRAPPHVTYADAAMLQRVLSCLSTACLSVATHLANAVVHDDSDGADMFASGVAAADGTTTTTATTMAAYARGPRARRRLWLQALTDAMSATHDGCGNGVDTDAVSLPHVLHVYHVSVDERLSRMTAQPQQGHASTRSSSSTADGRDAHAATMHVFCRDVCDCHACRTHSSRWAFVEPLHVNVHALLTAMQALIRVCSAAA